MLERSSGDGSGRGVIYKERGPGGLEDQGRISNGPSSGRSHQGERRRGFPAGHVAITRTRACPLLFLWSRGESAAELRDRINKQGAVEFAHANVVGEYTTSRRIGDWGRVAGSEDEGQWRMPLDQEET